MKAQYVKKIKQVNKRKQTKRIRTENIERLMTPRTKVKLYIRIRQEKYIKRKIIYESSFFEYFRYRNIISNIGVAFKSAFFFVFVQLTSLF